MPHGVFTAEGFRIEADGKALVYAPDCKEIPEPVFDLLDDLDVINLAATTERPTSSTSCRDVGRGATGWIH